MLGDVVAAALEVGRVLVVTDDASAVPRGAQAVADPGGGLGVAVAAGLADVVGHGLVVNADLPCATPDAIAELESAGLALVEAHDGTTNALSIPEPALFVPLYGPGSAGRFRAHAPFATLRIAELQHDIDVESDLESAPRPLGPRTQALISVSA
jgi:2-phospho-L-lactate guanylyltransferase (CobY/MobA/RfbA family)